MRLFLIPVLALVATSAIAAPAVTQQFSRDGYTYNYTERRAADGDLTLKGRVLPTGSNFALHVASNGRVTGTVGMTTVSFVASKATMEAIAAPDNTTLAAN